MKLFIITLLHIYFVLLSTFITINSKRMKKHHSHKHNRMYEPNDPTNKPTPLTYPALGYIPEDQYYAPHPNPLYHTQVASYKPHLDKEDLDVVHNIDLQGCTLMLGM